MAFVHIHFNDQLQYGRQLRRVLNMMEESDDLLVDVLSMMTLMIDGNGSDAAQFTEVKERFGFTDNASAKAAWDELQSANSKTSGNGSVDNVRAARDQLFSKLRG